jgi:hypothetical protein
VCAGYISAGAEAGSEVHFLFPRFIHSICDRTGWGKGRREREKQFSKTYYVHISKHCDCKSETVKL